MHFYVQTMKLLHLQPTQHRLDMQPLLDTIIFLGGVAQYYPSMLAQPLATKTYVFLKARTLVL